MFERKRSKPAQVSEDKAGQHCDVDGKINDRITAENFHYMVKCFTVNRGPRHPEDWSITLSPAEHPYEWGAWLHYARTRKLLPIMRKLDDMFRADIEFDEDKAAAVKWYFPAPLPSDFDAHWEPRHDKSAGEQYVRDLIRQVDKVRAGYEKFIDQHGMVTQTSPKKEAFPWED